jgi:hypothetical protein
VKDIGPECFCNCNDLCEVTFESGCKLESIGNYAFTLSGLRQIQIPSGVKNIGFGCFLGCKSLEEVTFESGRNLRKIGEEAFKLSGLRQIQIPSSVKVIGQMCFAGNLNVCNVIFESNPEQPVTVGGIVYPRPEPLCVRLSPDPGFYNPKAFPSALSAAASAVTGAGG